LPLENPLIFYPRWWAEASWALLRWAHLLLRYRLMMRRVMARPDARAYTDEAMQATPEGGIDHMVEAFADIMPHTYGAPLQAEAKAAQAG
jgi:hypothetical protein